MQHTSLALLLAFACLATAAGYITLAQIDTEPRTLSRVARYFEAALMLTISLIVLAAILFTPAPLPV